ncbi:MAG: thiamine pyrophosphate-dependent dehydrogenase E1 component subunit alpha [Chloroflexi bacterium]|nr:MAG: thiamine pyrophosphate-dependent dehydrogenase E1 component subunit alpha [Chloroflexota bacterium]
MAAMTKEAVNTHGLAKEQLLQMLEKMLLARALSVRQRMLQRMGKGPMTFSGEGHEAAQVGSAFALKPGVDWVFPYYRDVAVAVTIGMTPVDILRAFFARRDDINSGGRNMPSHFSHPSLRIVSGSAPIATQLPHAVGAALAAKLRKLDEIAVGYSGDGSTSTGDWHESMNFAGVQRLPVVFVCEHNNYAISVPWRKQAAIENVSIRAQGYGFPGVTVDGNDVLAVYGAMSEAVKRARAGEGPTLIEAKTYRLMPHSSDDDDRRYRTREEVEAWSAKDPVAEFPQQLKEMGVLNDNSEKEINDRVNHEVDAATDQVEQEPQPEAPTALRHVLVEGERS